MKILLGRTFLFFTWKTIGETNCQKQLIHQAEREGRAMHEGWRKRKDGSKFWGSIVITALHDRDG